MSDLETIIRDWFSTQIDDQGTPYRHIPEDRLALYTAAGGRGDIDSESMIALEYQNLDWKARNRK